MAKVPNIKRLSTEDFRDESTWIGKLLGPLNEFMSQTVFALNNRLNYADNLHAEIKELDFTVQASGTYPITFRCRFPEKPVGVWVGNAQEVATNPSAITSAVHVAWEWTGSQLQINNISGLTTGRRYKVTLFVSYG